MSLILIIGESGSGKSTSLRNLNPKETLLIQPIHKPLPFRGWKNKYYHDEDFCNRIVTETSEKIIKLLKCAHEKNKFKNIIIDDFQYIMSNEFMRRAYEKGFEKFTEIAFHAWEIIDYASRISHDMHIILLSHSQVDDYGKTKCKTIGKLLDDKITLEGLFTIVLQSKIMDDKYVFQTKNDGTNTVKTPMEMFEDKYIDNDLQLLINRIEEYENQDIPM